MSELPYPQNHPHYIQGVYAERERIIALLGDDAEIWHSENLQADLIALIKGENE